MSSDYQYTVPKETLDDYIDKMTRGIMPMVDDITFKEIEIRMHELAMEVEDMDDDAEAHIDALKSDVKEIQAKVQETKRRATRKDVAIFTLTDEQKQQLRREMSSSFVRAKPSAYNVDEETDKANREYQILRKRASKIRRCYYHPDDWINAVKTLLELVEYDKRNYPWLSDSEYYKAFWSGQIKLDVICPILYLDYHTPLKDPITLVGIYSGEVTIEEKPAYDETKRVRLKDDTITMVPVVPITEAESDYIQNLASRGIDTPMNILLNNTHKSLYDRFMPTSKTKVDPVRVQNYLSYIANGSKVKNKKFEPYETNDIISYIYSINNNELNTALNTNTTRWLSEISATQETKVDYGFKSSDQLVNAEAAMREASIITNIKSLSNLT